MSLGGMAGRKRPADENDNDDRRRPVVVELTSKKWKRKQLLGASLAVVGFFVGVLAHAADVKWLSAIGAIMIPVGIVIYFFARLGAWWEHG